MPHMDRLQQLVFLTTALLVMTGCNIRYISPGDVGESSAQKEAAASHQDTAETREDADSDAPWYAALMPGNWDAGSTEPHHPIGPTDPARTVTPPQATAAQHVETADQLHARTDIIDPNDPLRSTEHRWVMERGMTLEAGLRGWADHVGLQLRWDVPRIFRIEAPIVINGTFEYAFSRVMEAYALADRPVLFDYGLYSNQVLRVTLRGEAAP